MGPSGPAERMGKHASMRYIFVEIAASSGQDTAELTVPLRARHSLAHLPSKTAADSRPRLRPMVRLEHGSYRRQPKRSLDPGKVACLGALGRFRLPGT